MADNFSRQYSDLCPDRVPLFLHPVNECGLPVSQGRKGRPGADSRGQRETSRRPDLSWSGAHSPWEA